METRGCAASFDAARGELTFWASTQGPHLLRRRLALATGIPEGRIRVLVPDVGGGFGQKIPTHPEEVAVALAARALGRPVMWVEDRRENLVAAQQAKEQQIESELALAADGTFLGLRTPHRRECRRLLVQQRERPDRAIPLRCADAGRLHAGEPRVRGGRRSDEQAARRALPRHRLDGRALRPGAPDRRRLPTGSASTRVKSCAGTWSRPASSRIPRVRGWSTTREASWSRSTSPSNSSTTKGSASARKRLDRRAATSGSASVPTSSRPGGGREGSAQASWVLVSHDSARVTLEPSGEIAVCVGTPTQGQGHATVFAQIVADRLGVRIDDVRVRADDTSAVPISLSGTRASRTAVVVGGAVIQAADGTARTGARGRRRPARGRSGRPRGRRQAASAGAVETNRVLTLRQVAEAVYFRPDVRAALAEPEFSVTRFHDPKATYSNGCIVCVVEVDSGTGKVRVDRVVAVEDCGTMLNPLVVDGQIRGAVAQGIGAALLEHCDFDESGKPHRNTLFHYLLPTAVEIPPIEIDHCSSPSPYTPDGIKGMGESGMIATPAAVALAVADALEAARRAGRSPAAHPAAVAEMLQPTYEGRRPCTRSPRCSSRSARTARRAGSPTCTTSARRSTSRTSRG